MTKEELRTQFETTYRKKKYVLNRDGYGLYTNSATHAAWLAHLICAKANNIFKGRI